MTKLPGENKSSRSLCASCLWLPIRASQTALQPLVLIQSHAALILVKSAIEIICAFVCDTSVNHGGVGIHTGAFEVVNCFVSA